MGRCLPSYGDAGDRIRKALVQQDLLQGRPGSHAPAVSNNQNLRGTRRSSGQQEENGKNTNAQEPGHNGLPRGTAYLQMRIPNVSK